MAIAALSLLAPSAPTYDPWAWIQWGREVVHGALSTSYGPSWKPLPVLVCALLAPLGSAAPALWLIIARAGGVLGVLACALLAAELAPRGSGRLASTAARRWLRLLAGAVAAGALLVAGLNFDLWGTSFAGSVWQGNSEGLLTACAIGAVLCHRARRLGWALALGVAAALLRPETWPFLAAYAVWLWRERAVVRGWLVAGLALVPALWFGAELWGSGELFRGAARAQAITPDNPATTQSAAHAVLSRSRPYVLITIQVAVLVAALSALVGVALGRRRGRGATPGPNCLVSPPAPGGQTRQLGRSADPADPADPARSTPADPADRARSTPPDRADATTLALALFGAAWLGLVALMAQLRIASGNPRYVLLSVSVAAILGGVGVARLTAWIGARFAPRAAVAAAVALSAGVVISALPQLRGISRDINHLRYEVALDRALPTAITHAGGRAVVLRCGTPVTGSLSVTALAWRLNVPIERIKLAPAPGTVVFRAAPTLDDPPAPPTTGGLEQIATAGAWTVATDCPASKRLSQRLSNGTQR